MKAARIVVLAVALGAGGIAAYLASGSKEAPPAAPAPVVQIDTVEILAAKADISVEPCGTSLSSEKARAPAIRCKWVRGTGRKPSAVTSKEIIAALRPSSTIGRVVDD